MTDEHKFEKRKAMPKFTIMILDQDTGEVAMMEKDINALILQTGKYEEDSLNAPIRMIGEFKAHMEMADVWDKTGEKIKRALIDTFFKEHPLAEGFKEHMAKKNVPGSG